MIKLEQVSTARLIDYLRYSYVHNRKPQTQREIEINRCYEVLIKYNITNFGQLKDYIDSGLVEFQIEYLKKSLLEIEIAVFEAARTGNEPVLYSADDYAEFDTDRETLNITDKETNGGILLCGNILSRRTSQRNVLKTYSIYELKQLLNNVVVTRCKFRGENALVHNLKEVSDEAALRVRDAINFYERQVIRQADEYQWSRGVNLFRIDKDLKIEAIKEQIYDVIMYLLDNAEECVWGTFTANQKRLLDKSIHGSRNYEAQTAHDNMVEAISNYTTLGELEEGLVRTRVINRFIKN
ncbi:MAG: hypothetical protein E7161_03070 [Firmicutes bacterium]|nr:hypothetical protein [Bacillota bacterium]